LKKMLNLDWKKNPQAAFAATLIGRNCGDRARDIDEGLRNLITDKLKISKCPSPWLEMIEHYKELDEKEKNQFFGEALPPGLKLIHDDR
jgi:DNA-K related protein